MENWDKINAVQRMQDYIVSHINEEITMQDLSNVSGYSLFHSIRIFKELTLKTPFEYIRALKLTKAAEQLRDTESKVIEIALDANYDSHEGFTRAFNSQFDITPSEYNKNKPPVSFFTYYPISHYYLYTKKRNDKIMEKNRVSKTVTVQAVERPARKLIVLRSKKATDYMSYCEEMGCDWEGLMNSLSEKVDNAALLELPKKLVKEGTSEYAAGIEVPLEFAKTVPQGYEVFELPACKMLYFQGMPFDNEEDFCEAIEIVDEAIKNYKPETFGYKFAFDIAPRFNFGASAQTGAKMAIPIE